MERNVKKWTINEFRDFNKGNFVNGGDNLYVNRKGIIENIHRFDLNNDGYVDLILCNNHGYIERGPTWIYKLVNKNGVNLKRQELPNDSGWMSKVIDIDGDGWPDLIVVNGENGVTSELDSYIYWGGPEGLSGKVEKLPTAGAYDVAVLDINGNGLLDIIFTSAWVDHHNPGTERLMNVFIQKEPRKFENETSKYGLKGFGTVSIACDDLNGNGYPDIVLANYRKEFEYNTYSYIYWGSKNGYSPESLLKLPTHYALQVILGDLNNDGFKEIVFCGGNEVWIYWNNEGEFNRGDREIIKTEGLSTMFSIGMVYAEIADIDKDGLNEIILATKDGIEIRSSDNLQKVRTFLSHKNSTRVQSYDLNNDGYPDLIVSRYQDDVTYEADSTLFWNCEGSFRVDKKTLLPTSGAIGCSAGDLDSDGIPEIIFNNTLQGYAQTYTQFPVYAYLGDSKSTYSKKNRIEYPNAGGGGTYVLADLNLNGYPDLVLVSQEGARVFWGSQEGPTPNNYTILSKPSARPMSPCLNVYVADFNKDGWLDIMMIAQSFDHKPETMKNSSFIFYGSAKGFQKDNMKSIPTFCKGTANVADLNNDGWLDIIYGDNRGYLVVYLGGPKGYSTDRVWKIYLEIPEHVDICHINSADINKNGWLDLVVGIASHRIRKQSGFFIIYGGPKGFSTKSVDFQPTEASPDIITIADINQDGNLDLLVPQYSTEFTRELDAHIYYGNGKGFDFNKPESIPCNASCDFTAVDVTGNEYPDILVACHRNDLGHQVDSLLFFNGPDGIDLKNPKYLPCLGPHGTVSRDFGNGKDRRPVEYYESEIKNIKGKRPKSINWKGEIPFGTQLKIQLRWGINREDIQENNWGGPLGEDTYYEVSGSEIKNVQNSVNFLQFRVLFISKNGCASPKLEEVSIEFS